MRPDVHDQEDDAPHDQLLTPERLDSRIEASPPYFFQGYGPEDCCDHRQYDSRDLLRGQSQQREKDGDTNQPRCPKPHSAPTFHMKPDSGEHCDHQTIKDKYMAQYCKNQSHSRLKQPNNYKCNPVHSILPRYIISLYHSGRLVRPR